MQRDPELDDILQDDELRHVADLLRSTRMAEPPLDEAFRSALRRQLMQKAWGAEKEKRPSWWSRLVAPPGLAWAGAAAGVVLIASVAVYMSTQGPGLITNEIHIDSPVADKSSVQLSQPILVAFNQPMDHVSTQAAVQITPATTVLFSWRANTLAVQPTSGGLAPNTHYELTIGPGAKTATGQSLNTPKTITFVTQQKRPTPSPTPPPTAAPTSLLGPLVQLAPIPQGTFYTPQWSADSSTVYFVGEGGALLAVSSKGGTVKVLVTGGASLPAISPAGDQLAYVSGDKIEILDLAGAKTTEVSPSRTPTALGWVKAALYWGEPGGVYSLGQNGPVRVADLPPPSDGASVISIAPDGAHAAYTAGSQLFVLDVSTGKGTQLGTESAVFQGWSPDGSRVLYSGVIADAAGNTIATLLGGDPSWSAQDQVLLGTDTELYVQRPNGWGLTKLADGTYHRPVWAPNGTAFAFLRGQSLWATTAPAPPAAPAALDEASAVANNFMQARLQGDSSKASTFLDAAGKAAYSAQGGPALIPDSTLGFKRYYILSVEPDQSGPNSVRIVVRLVFGHGKDETSALEETLILARAESTDPYLIDSASAGGQLNLTTGPQVVGVDVTIDTVRVTFDSDLVAESIASGILLVDDKGKQLGEAPSYANRVVTITGLKLKAGDSYKLQVLTTVLDVSGHNIATEYDLTIVGPGEAHGQGGGNGQGGGPTASPTPGA
jgi:hypothetical protein